MSRKKMGLPINILKIYDGYGEFEMHIKRGIGVARLISLKWDWGSNASGGSPAGIKVCLSARAEI